MFKRIATQLVQAARAGKALFNRPKGPAGADAAGSVGTSRETTATTLLKGAASAAASSAVAGFIAWELGRTKQAEKLKETKAKLEEAEKAAVASEKSLLEKQRELTAQVIHLTDLLRGSDEKNAELSAKLRRAEEKTSLLKQDLRTRSDRLQETRAALLTSETKHNLSWCFWRAQLTEPRAASEDTSAAAPPHDQPKP